MTAKDLRTSTGSHENRVMCVLLLGGFLLRFWGFWFGLPHLYHADEPIIVNHALAYGTGDLNPHFFKIPPLISYLLFAVYGLIFLCGKLAGVFSNVEAYEHLFYRDPSLFYLAGRMLFGVMAGTATLAYLFRVIKQHLGSRLGLLAAFLLATCFLHVRDSHYLYTDILLLFVLIAVWDRSFTVLRGESRIRDHLLAGAVIGLATAVKYNGAFFSVIYVTAVLLSNKRLSRSMGRLVVAGATAGMTFLMLNPFALVDSSTFATELGTQSASNTGVSWVHHLLYSLPGGLGWGLFFISLVALVYVVYAFFKNRESKHLQYLFCVAVFQGIYYLVLCRFAQPYDRYVLPLLPGAVLLSGAFIHAVFRLGRDGKAMTSGQRILFPVLMVVLTAQPVMSSILFGQIMSRKDTRTLAAEWVEEHVPAETGIALGWDFYMPRLRFSSGQLKQKLLKLESASGGKVSSVRKIHYLLDHPGEKPVFKLWFLSDEPEAKQRFTFAEPLVGYDLDALRERGVEYVILVRLAPVESFQPFFRQLKANAEFVKRVSPYRDSFRKLPIDRQPLTGGPFLWQELRARERNGQPLEIYRLRPVE